MFVKSAGLSGSRLTTTAFPVKNILSIIV
jgi:hypothetical protein